MIMKNDPAHSEDKFRLAFESANVGKSITLPTGEINVNKAFCDMLGYSSDELRNKRWQDITPAEDIESTQLLMDQLLQARKDEIRFNKRYVHKNGSYVWGDVSVAIQRDVELKPLFFITTIVDITERIRAEKALQESSVLFAKITSQVPGMLYQFKRKPDGTFSMPYSNDGIREIFGCSPDDVRDNARPVFNAILPEDRDRVILTIEESAEKLEPWICEYRVQLPGKQVRWMLGNSIPEKTADGSVIWAGYNTDITERKLVEEALNESETIFNRFMEHSPIYVFFKDENIRTIRLSKNYEKMLGRPMTELLGKTMYDLFPSELAKNMVADDLRILNEGREITVDEEFNGRFYTTIKFPIHIDGKPRYLAGYTIDITERKESEAALRSKMSEMESFLRVTVGRELAMIELKKQINELLKQLGREERYEIVE
jgi:PAS domain S-box-containing protein